MIAGVASEEFDLDRLVNFGRFPVVHQTGPCQERMEKRESEMVMASALKAVESFEA